MNIRIGDIVRFLTDKLEGKVTAIADSTTVHVFVEEYGFEIPASTNDLVVIHSDFAQSDKPGQPTPAQQKQGDLATPHNGYVAIVAGQLQ